jgi:hypothetical protein
MGHDGTLQREPAWAVFTDGVPEALPPQVEVRVEARAEAPAGAE